MGDRQPWPAFEYFCVYRVSVLGVGDAQKRDVGLDGWGGDGGSGEFFISQTGKKSKGPTAPWDQV